MKLEAGLRAMLTRTARSLPLLLREDAIQEAEIHIWLAERKPGVQSCGNLRRRIAHATMIDLVRRNRFHRYGPSREDTPHLQVPLNSLIVAPDQQQLAEDAELRREVALLPATTRLVIEGLYWQGDSALDLATLTGYHVSRIYQLKDAGIRQLRLHFGGSHCVR